MLSTSSFSKTRVLGFALVIGLFATGCMGPVENWVPDFNNDGEITQDEVDFQSAIVIDNVTKAVDAHRRDVQRHPFLVCIRHHESDRGPYPHTNGYGAENPRSSASGAYQFIDGTWRNASAQAGFPGYSRAKYAPWFVQDAVILHVINNGGRSHWNGAGC